MTRNLPADFAGFSSSPIFRNAEMIVPLGSLAALPDPPHRPETLRRPGGSGGQEFRQHQIQMKVVLSLEPGLIHHVRAHDGEKI